MSIVTTAELAGVLTFRVTNIFYGNLKHHQEILTLPLTGIFILRNLFTYLLLFPPKLYPRLPISGPAVVNGIRWKESTERELQRELRKVKAQIRELKKEV
jgi:hypothetical protein